VKKRKYSFALPASPTAAACRKASEDKKEIRPQNRSHAVQLRHARQHRALARSMTEKLLYTRSLLNYGD
jgi:hypothetical protein